MLLRLVLIEFIYNFLRIYGPSRNKAGERMRGEVNALLFRYLLIPQYLETGNIFILLQVHILKVFNFPSFIHQCPFPT